MKFIRRHDLDPHTRIEMVRLAWLHQGIYGKMTQIAQAYHVSRTFLYQMTWAAHLQLERLFSDPQALVQAPQPLWEPLILLLRLEGKCSIPSMSSILKYFQYQPNSVGYLSACFHTYGGALPPTLSIAEHKVVFYLSDEIFARHQPILVTIEAQSTAILKIGTSQMPIDSFNTNLWWWYDGDQSIESLRLITATHQPEATRCSLSDAQI
jgi:hypothetical protein